jgi:hypothetical protein
VGSGLASISLKKIKEIQFLAFQMTNFLITQYLRAESGSREELENMDGLEVLRRTEMDAKMGSTMPCPVSFSFHTTM